MADYWKEANMSLLQREGRLEKAFQEPLGEAAPAVWTTSGLDSVLSCLAAPHSLLRPRSQLLVGP